MDAGWRGGCRVEGWMQGGREGESVEGNDAEWEGGKEGERGKGWMRFGREGESEGGMEAGRKKEGKEREREGGR